MPYGVKGENIAAFGTPEEIFSNDTIKDLYGISSGSFNALLGNIELSPPEGEIRCFVIGGGGFGIPFYRTLQKKGIPFAAGILPENDIDLAVALPLAKTTVHAPLYQMPGEEETDTAKKLIDSVETVIDAGCPAGELNSFNTELISYAQKQGKTLIRTLTALSEANL